MKFSELWLREWVNPAIAANIHFCHTQFVSDDYGLLQW